MNPRPAAGSRAELVTWLGIADANSGGFIHGGTVMKLWTKPPAWRPSSTRAAAWSRRRWDRMTFIDRIAVGELLLLRAAVNAVWRTSMERDAQTRRRNRLTERDEIVTARGEEEGY